MEVHKATSTTCTNIYWCYYYTLREEKSSYNHTTMHGCRATPHARSRGAAAVLIGARTGSASSSAAAGQTKHRRRERERERERERAAHAHRCKNRGEAKL
jgi:hypothetical protein